MATKLKVTLFIPMIGLISGEWRPDEAERRAAWELYVELVTRIPVAELKPDEGLLRDALSSLYTLFGSTRAILRSYGPAVAPKRRNGKLSLGSIAVAMLNGAVRPTLARWHPLLHDYEMTRPPHVSPLQHERAWVHEADLRQELNQMRRMLTDAAQLLARVCHVSDLIPLAAGPEPAAMTSIPHPRAVETPADVPTDRQ